MISAALALVLAMAIGITSATGERAAVAAQGISSSTDGPFSGPAHQPIMMSGAISPAGLAVGEWQWNFGDGTTGAGQQVAKIYGSPGVYTITLTVRPANEGAVTTTTTATVTPAASQSAIWLDNPQPGNWNVPGMPVPVAPRAELPIDPRFIEQNRLPETPADEQLVAAGWYLFTSYQAGWGVLVVPATSGHDGMGRPLGYQFFVFADSVYAGALSPTLMASRSDGALTYSMLTGSDSLWGEFQRYTPSDALCCPSGSTTVTYQMIAAAVVVPDSASTQWTQEPPATEAPAETGLVRP
jgi:PKD repeat protein